MRRSAPSRLGPGVALGLAGLCSALLLPSEPADAATARPTGSITVGACLPPYSLSPTDAEPCSATAIGGLFTGLTIDEPGTGRPTPAMAQRLSSTDNRHWTVTLKAGMTFADRTPVDARSFVDAWNWSAYGPNGSGSAYFFLPLQGAAALQGTDRNGDGRVSASEAPVTKMSGLHVVDARTFTVTLSSPSPAFPSMVGNAAFSPLPRSFFRKPSAFAEHPVGNGPYVFAGKDRGGYHLAARPAYRGPVTAGVAKVYFKGFATEEAEYAQLRAGRLDWIQQVPTAALVDGRYRSQLGKGHFTTATTGSITSVTVPTYLPEYADPDLARAVSLAIDRRAIVDDVFSGARTPATGWVAPGVDGYRPGACGAFCTYDPVRARAYLAKVAKVPDTLTLAFNVDGTGNLQIADAVCHSVSTTLRVPCQTKPYKDFDALQDAEDTGEVGAMFRNGWLMDYSSIEDFLVPLFGTRQPFNDNDFSDATFDALLRSAAATRSRVAAKALYQRAEARLSLSMSTIPLWYGAVQSAWSPRLSHVRIIGTGQLDLSAVRAR